MSLNNEGVLESLDIFTKLKVLISLISEKNGNNYPDLSKDTLYYNGIDFAPAVIFFMFDFYNPNVSQASQPFDTEIKWSQILPFL